jgi:PAS domain S-box-containing protein
MSRLTDLLESRAEDGLELLPVAVHVLDAHGRFVWANDAWLRLLGYGRDEVQGQMLLSELVTPDERQRIDACLVRVRDEGRIDALSWTMLRKDGVALRVHLSATALREADGTFAGALATVCDASPLWDAAQRADLLLDATPDAVIFVDEAGRIIRANDETLDLFGYARDELVGASVELLVPEALRAGHAGHRASHGSAPRGRRAKTRRPEFTARRRDGSELPVEISLASLPTSDGIVTAAAIRDMTERRRLERETTRLAERFVDTVELDEMPFALFDETDRLVLSNAAFRSELCGTLEGPIEGRSWDGTVGRAIDAGVFVETSPPSLRARWEGYRAHPDGALDLATSDGRRWRIVERPTREGGRALTVHDRTEDVRTAEELASERSRAEAASLAKSEFLSSMSHELRTPLNSVLGFAQLLLRDTRSTLSEPQHRNVSRILAGGQHLLRLIDDILDLSRIESGVLSLSLEPVRVRPLLDEVRDSMTPAAQRAGVRLTVQCEDDDRAVLADRTRLRQIVLNFVSNAIKYGGAGGHVELACEARSPQLRVTVRDDGPGVPVEDRARLFDSFFRGVQRAGPIEGTGIGLAICRRLATAMRGRVGFDCASAGGSVFWVELPATALARPERRRASASSGAFAAPARIGEKIVVYVEDNAANVELMREMFTSVHDTRLRVATTGADGLALIRQLHPALILMDLNLPDMSGYDVFRQLRASPETSDVPTFAVSASAMKNETERAREAGFARFFPKPFDIDELSRAIEDVLRGGGVQRA